MKPLSLLCCLLLAGCQPKPKPIEWPELAAKATAAHRSYRMWCYDDGSCYGTLWDSSDGDFLSRKFAHTVQGTTREEVVQKLIEDMNAPLQPSGHFGESYEATGP